MGTTTNAADESEDQVLNINKSKTKVMLAIHINICKYHACRELRKQRLPGTVKHF